MTQVEFIAWLTDTRVPVFVWPYDVVPCRCGDVNCKGWRLVARVAAPLAPVRPRGELVTT